VPAPTPSLQRLADGPARWHTIEHHEQVGSTNDLALASLRAGTPPGHVISADRQTAGRGRRGRSWQDRPAGASLATSVTLPSLADHNALVPLVAGVAVVDALRRAGVLAGLKWPNDAVVELSDGGRAKLAGILAEAVPEGIVVGVGLNVDLRGQEPVEGATSAAEVLGADVDRWELLQEYLGALESWLGDLVTDGPLRLVAAYRGLCTTLGRDVIATVGDGEVVGRAVEVAPDGALVVRTGAGARVAVSSGEVVHLR